MTWRTSALVAMTAIAMLAPVPVAHAQSGTTDRAARLAQIVASDDTAHLSKDGKHLYYVDPAPPAPPGVTARRSVRTITGNAAAGLAIPALHSHPSSTHTIFLDFDGTTIGSSNAWHTQCTTDCLATGTYSGFSLDGDAAFDATEVAFIEKVWRIVAEKYAPWDVDVTTVDPGVSGYTRTSSGDTTYGTHVVISSATDAGSPVQQICGGGCAGIAWVDVFDTVGAASYEPAWVFEGMAYGSAQLTAHDAAHEVGHTLGLNHDGTTAQGDGSYYQGQGNWVPIMGLTDQNAVAQWGKGQYPDANNTQDDLAVIGANGDSGAAGSLLLADDYPNAGGTPAALGNATSYQVDGIISSSADSDLFSVVRTCASPLVVTGTGMDGSGQTSGQTLDMKISILTNANGVLTSDDPVSGQDTSVQPDGDIGYLPTGMNASATWASAAAGTTYRILVQGVGTDDGTHGYTSYASIGRYHLQISGCPAGSGTPPSAPGSVSATPNARTTTAELSWTAPDPGTDPILGYKVTGVPGNPSFGPGVTSTTLTGLAPGTTYTVNVVAYSVDGDSAPGTDSVRIETYVPSVAPGLSVTTSGTSATLHWSAAPNSGNATLTDWNITLLRGSTQLDDENIGNPAQLSGTFPSLPVGSYSVKLTPLYTADDTAGIVPATRSFTIITQPSAPRIGTASSGKRHKPVTATVRWAPPTSTGGSPITAYRVVASKIGKHGTVVRTSTSRARPASARSYTWKLPAGRYKFRVVAYNRAGASPRSGYSRIVTAR